MKIPPRNLDGFVKKPPADMLAVLVYGPDEGLVRERMKLLSLTVVEDANDPFNAVEITNEQLLDSPSLLTDEARSISMLGGRRVIRLRGATDKVAGIVKDTLAALKPGDNLVLVESDSLSPRAPLRLLFENADNAAAVPCYVDDERDIGRVIEGGLRDAGYSAAPEALAFMASSVVGDRAVARGEIEKLITYMGPGNTRVALEDVMACTGDSAALALDDLVRHVSTGQFADADRALTLLLSEGTAAVAIIRALMNHFSRVHITKAHVQNGDSLDMAMKRLRPAVFFKQKPAFEAQVNNMTMDRLEQALAILGGAEARCKQTGGNPDVITGRAVLALCQIAGRALRRRA